MDNIEGSREYTEDEIKEKVINHIRSIVDYWETLDKDVSVRYRLSGVAFSILSMLDGSSELPAFIVAPSPNETDKQYHIDLGENYYPENYEIVDSIKGNICGGEFHHLLFEDWE